MTKKKKIQSNVDDDLSLSEYIKIIQNENKAKKNQFWESIVENGDDYVSEMNINKKRRDEKVQILIDYILTFSDGYTEHDLDKYDDKEIYKIYFNLRKSERSFLRKFFDFLFK